MHVFQHLLLYIVGSSKLILVNKQKSLVSLSLTSSWVRRAATVDGTKLETIAIGCPLTT